MYSAVVIDSIYTATILEFKQSLGCWALELRTSALAWKLEGLSVIVISKLHFFSKPQNIFAYSERTAL